MSGPRRFVDLHAHTTASDGSAPPAEVVRMADALGLAAVAVTDHDTTAGLGEARAAAASLAELRLVPGLEVSAACEAGTMHLLGLGIDEDAPAVRELTAWYRSAREERNPKILARLRAMGVPIDMEDVLAVAGRGAPGAARIVSRVHIAEALRRKGFVASADEAFARYIGSGAPAYVAKARRDPGDVIAAIRAGGGAAVLAHPVQLGCEDAGRLEALVRRLRDAGLDGIEVYHGDHTDAQTRGYLDLARRLGLLVTGGSDFHGAAKPGVRLGRPRVPISVVAEPWASRWFGDR